MIGVLEALSSSDDTSNNDVALVPFATYSHRLVGGEDRDSVSSIYVKASEAATLSAAYQETDATLRNLHGITSDDDVDFSIATQESILTAASSVDRTLTVMLGGIAVISLLVGGIGVMNIMLVSVTERIREIGLRKALGAKPRIIRRQFLVEASLLGLAGGLLGVTLGVVGALVLPPSPTSASSCRCRCRSWPSSWPSASACCSACTPRHAPPASPPSTPSGVNDMPLPAFLADTPSSVRRLAAAGLVALFAVMVVAVAANGQSSSGHYRTATATTSSVDQVLESVATIEPVTQAAVAFPIAGTVESVEVGVGDRVAVGTTLAELDSASLERTLRQQQAALDQAELTLERALERRSGRDRHRSIRRHRGDPHRLRDLRGGVVRCRRPRRGPDDRRPERAERRRHRRGPTGAAQRATAGRCGPRRGAAGDRQRRLGVRGGRLRRRRRVSRRAHRLHRRHQRRGRGAAGGPVQPGRSQQRGGDPGRPARPARRRSGRAAADHDPADPTVAADPFDRRRPALSSVRSPRPAPSAAAPASRRSGSSRCSGPSTRRRSRSSWPNRPSPRPPSSVRSPARSSRSNLAPGDEVDAASATANIIISGRGGYEATVNVSVDDLADLEVGQAATVRPDGSDEEIEGEVVAIGVAANAGSFPITIGLHGNTRQLGNGSTATADDHDLGGPRTR